MFSRYGFVTDMSCWVIIMVDSAQCLALHPNLTTSIVLFFISWLLAQSSRIMRLFVPLKIPTTYLSNNSISSWSHGMVPFLISSIPPKSRTEYYSSFKVFHVLIFQHRQQVVRFTTCGHTYYEHIKWCLHIYYNMQPQYWMLFSSPLTMLRRPSATTNK